MPISENGIVRDVRRDLSRKARLLSGVAPYVGSFAFDAAVPEMTAKEFSVQALRRLGQTRAAEGADPVSALEVWLAGKRSAAAIARGERPSFAQDAGESFIDRYLKE